MSDDTPQERQDNEIEALKAIFGDDLRDLRTAKPWKIWQPLDILLTLLPQQGSSGNQEIHCSVDLHITCPAKYPEMEPSLEVKQSKGLSDFQLSTLLAELHALAASLKGEVMIFELAQHVQRFLHGYNKPGFKSFYEEMLSIQKQNEQMKLRDQQVKEDRERQEIKEEILRRQEILKSGMKMRKDPRVSLCQELVTEPSALPSPLMAVNPALERTRTYSTRRRCQSTSESSEGSFCEHRGTKLLQFSFRGDRQVNRGRCLGHSERGCVVYGALDTVTGELLAVSEWSVRLQSAPSAPAARLPSTAKKKDSPSHAAPPALDLSACMKQVASIEQEFSFLMKLHHTNLVHYVNMKYIHDNDTLMVYLLQEFVFGGSLSCLYLKERTGVEADTLRHVAAGLLEALDFLHRNNVVHKDLRDSSVFLDRGGAVRLADYSLDRRLAELCHAGAQSGRYSKKQDIFRVGVILVSLLRGSPATEALPQVPAGLSQDLKDFLFRCLDDERTRWSAEQLLNHQFIKAPMDRTSPQRSCDLNGRACSDDGHGDSPEAMDVQLFIPAGASGQSRIKNEFEILKWLGKGAFGDVLKVRNKLDGGSYAIKRIELDPKNKQLNKKITREVKLLSRLNHENVVRYYNSWIESACLEPRLVTPPPRHNHHQSIESLDKNQDLEKQAQSMEWSVSYSSRSKLPSQAVEEVSSSSSDSSESEDDEDDVLINYIREIKKSSSSDSIEFKYEGSFESQPDTRTPQIKEKSEKTSPQRTRTGSQDSVQIQYLYIQMEFCEKSTLRNVIDNGLHLDPDRMWRLFREIVEGLSHIHQQGMIHRDLKPVNIFMDSNDHVKIGDFGLATNILPRAMQSVVELRSPPEMDSFSQDVGDGSLTGHVGTALYVAPELTTTGSKAIYNQKVDIYSLGIVLFEMSYPPLKTGMERVKTLASLRTKEIVMPQAFVTQENAKQVYLIRWLLNHEASGRPTCAELLQCEQLPGLLEEEELQDLLRHALLDTRSKAYKHLINACFQQELSPAEDITYDMNLLKTAASHQRKAHMLATFVKETVIKVFKLHSGVELSPPLFLPRCARYDGVESSVRLMTHGGGIVHVPHDLRVPFARYIVWNGITSLKRYSVEKVYRENKVYGFHPTELYECSFDIVTPTPGNLFAEAELLSIVCEIAGEFPSMKGRNLTIRLNHTNLLRAVLLNCFIEPEKYNDIYTIFSDARDDKLSKFQVQTRLISLCLSDQAMVPLFSLMETECPVHKLSHVLKTFMRRKGEASSLAREAVRELETIVHNAEALGVRCPILVCPCMVYNIQQYSGMMCQFVCELKKKRRKGAVDVIAAGGRYDGMLADLRKTVQHSGLGGRSEASSQAAAGISLSLERLMQAAGSSLDEEAGLSFENSDVCVCATSSSKQATREKAQIASALWAAGVRASLIETTNLNEIQDLYRELSTTHLIILRDSEPGTAQVRSWERDRFQERNVPTNEVVEFMQRLVKTWNENPENPWSTATAVTKSDSRINFADFDRQPSSNLPVVSVNFITPEKLAANARRRYETQILSQMSSTVQKLSPKNRIEVLALSIDNAVLRSLATHLESDVPQEEHDGAVRAIIERHPRHKKYLAQVCDEFRDLCLERTRPVIALYSLADSRFKLLF